MLKKLDLFLLPFLYGLATLGFQSLFIRHLIALFGPSEISYTLLITIWLLFTGIGAYIAEAFMRDYRAGYSILCIYGLAASITYSLIPELCNLWGLKAGEIVGYLTTALSAAIILVIPCLISGAIFVGVVNRIADFRKEKNLPYAYVVESLGALAAGLLITFAALPNLPDKWTVLILLTMLVIFMLSRGEKRKPFPVRLLVGIPPLLLAGWLILGVPGHQFGNQRTVAAMDTPYQNLVATEYDSQFTIYGSGRKLFSYPQEDEAERVHLILWQKRQIRKIALIGLCSPDKLMEILKYPKCQADLFELDRDLLKFATRTLPQEAIGVLGDQRIRLITGDPFATMFAQKTRYDFVILNLSNPTDGVSNRYFTVDFFHKIKESLAPDGILALSVPGSGNLLRENLSEYLSVLYNSLKVEFTQVNIIPADDFIFLASPNADAILDNQADMLQSRRQNKIETKLIDSLYLAYLFDPLRTMKLEKIYSNSIPLTNTLARPMVYYFNSILWAERFSNFETSFLKFWRDHRQLIYLLLLLPAIPLVFLLGSALRRLYFSLAYLAGFGGMALQIAVLILYQSHLGNVYSQIGLLTALFMMGLALGGMIPFLAKKDSQISRSQSILPPILGFLVLLGMSSAAGLEGGIATQRILFLGLALFSGGFSGLLFNLAAVEFRNRYGIEKPGWFYLSDLVGSALSGSLISIVLVPLMGLGFVLLLFIILLIVYLIIRLIMMVRI